jgi:hypothetical protein
LYKTLSFPVFLTARLFNSVFTLFPYFSISQRTSLALITPLKAQPNLDSKNQLRLTGQFVSSLIHYPNLVRLGSAKIDTLFIHTTLFEKKNRKCFTPQPLNLHRIAL